MAYLAKGGGRFVIGDGDMVRRLNVLAERTSRSAQAALLEEGWAIINDAKFNYVPVDEADLRDSGEAQVRRRNPREFEVLLSFGGYGDTSEYAIAVHEHPSKHSPPSWRGTRGAGGRFRSVQFHPAGHGPKYLEKPLNAAAPGFLDRIGQRITMVR